MHTPPETKYTALASRSSPGQLLKWWDRWRHYLRSVANVCISFEIALVVLQCSKFFSLHFQSNYKIVTKMLMCQGIQTSSPSSPRHVLNDAVSCCFETFCPTPYRSSAARRGLQNLLGIFILPILLSRSLQLCLCLPMYSNTGSVFGFSIISPFYLWSHCAQPAVGLINRFSAAVILITSFCK